MILKIAWKNIGRNKIRSSILILSVFIGTLGGTLYIAWMEGMIQQKVDDSIKIEVGHLKLYMPSYLLNNEITDTIPNSQKITDALTQNKSIKSVSRHTKVIAMATTTRSNSGVKLIGITPSEEKKSSELYNYLLFGNYFEKKKKLPQALIGDKLAENLGIKFYQIKQTNLVKTNKIDSLIIHKLAPIFEKRYYTKKKLKKELQNYLTKKEFETFYQPIKKATTTYNKRAKITFSFTNTQKELDFLTCRIIGIYKTSNILFDQLHVFLTQETLTKAAQLPSNSCHEITILAKSENEKRLKKLQKEIQKKQPQLTIHSLQQTAPDAYSFKLMSTPMMLILMLIIYFALAFAITNTMMMAILERTKEIGMLRAIGLSNRKISLMICYETIFLSSIGAIIGILISAIIIAILGKTGVNFYGEAFESVGISAIIYPTLRPIFYFIVTCLVIIISLLAAFVPIHKILKQKPIEAIASES